MFTAAATSLGGPVGYVAGVVGSAVMGYQAGFATSFLTQGLAILVGLQEDFDWKAMREMGETMAVSAAFAGASGGLSGMSGGAQMAASAALEAGRQYAQDGEITNVSGLAMAMAMVPGAKKLDNVKWLQDTATKIDQYKNSVSAGLAVLESSIRGDDASMSWVNLAAAAVSGPSSGQSYMVSTGFDWTRVAQEALVSAGLSLVVAHRFGEDAALNFLGASLGQTVGRMAVDYDKAHGGPIGMLSDAEVRAKQKAIERQREAQQQTANNAAPNPNPAGAGAREMHYNPATGRYEDETGRPMPAMVASNTYSDGRVMSDAYQEPLQMGAPMTGTPESEAMYQALVAMMQSPANDTIDGGMMGPPTPAQYVADVLNDPNATQSDIMAMQQILVDAGYDLGAYGALRDGVDGRLGNMTRAGAEQFLSDRGGVAQLDAMLDEAVRMQTAIDGMATQGQGFALKADGSIAGLEIANTNTARLNTLAGSLQRGDRGNDVKELQRLLGVTDDGIFGKQTESALAAYQNAGAANLNAPINLGVNQRFAAELVAAAQAENFNPLVAAAFINAEAAKNPDGSWRVDSLNTESQAAGLGQFIPDTWKRMALAEGTSLNARATALGYVENGQIKNEVALLALRTDENEVGLMFSTMMENNNKDYDYLVRQQKHGAPVIPNNLSLQQEAELRYKIHHEGRGGMRGYLGLTSTYPRLDARIADNPASRSYIQGNNYQDKVSGYTAWLDVYTARQINVERYLP